MDFRTIGGNRLIKTFSDSFTRANATYVGPSYIFSAAFGATQNMTTSYGIGSNMLGVTDSTVNQTQFFPECLIPIQGAPNLNGKSQFGKITWVNGNNVAGTRSLHCGIAVLISISSTLGYSCYTVEMQDETSNQNLITRKFTQSGGYTTLFTGTVGSAPNSSSHVMELSAVPGVSSTVLKTFLDGVLINTTTDSSSPIITGVPGFCRPLYVTTASPGVSQQNFDNFSIGPGQ